MGSSAAASLVYGYCIDYDYGVNGIPEWEELEELGIETKEEWLWKQAHTNMPSEHQDCQAQYDWQHEKAVLAYCGGLKTSANGNAYVGSEDEALFVHAKKFWACGYGYEEVDLSDIHSQMNSVSSKLHKFATLLPMMDLGKPRWYLVASYG